MVHEFENEAEWVLPGRIDPDERHETFVIVVEETACQCFLVQPLQGRFSEQGSLGEQLTLTKQTDKQLDEE